MTLPVAGITVHHRSSPDITGHHRTNLVFLGESTNEAGDILVLYCSLSRITGGRTTDEPATMNLCDLPLVCRGPWATLWV
jgi:hypothetical protein